MDIICVLLFPQDLKELGQCLAGIVQGKHQKSFLSSGAMLFQLVKKDFSFWLWALLRLFLESCQIETRPSTNGPRRRFCMWFTKTTHPFVHKTTLLMKWKQKGRSRRLEFLNPLWLKG
jgi:hypothetical protein